MSESATSDDDPVDPLVGQMLAERYRIVRRIGRGGMGVVYEAEHTLLGRRTGIKVLHPQLAADRDTLRRFMNEAKAAATLDHPGILEATDMGYTNEGAPFVVFELLIGDNLEEAIEREGPLPSDRAVAIALQVASALRAAHERSIVHRDLKPENIFLLRNHPEGLRVKVLDFGISKFAESVNAVRTETGSILGSPAYMAPEQMVDSSRVDVRTDIYGLGAVLYQALTASRPFDGDSLPQLVQRVCFEPPVPVASRRAGVPPELAALIERCLAKDAEQRPQDMTELADALRAFTSSDYPTGGGDATPAQAGSHPAPPVHSAAAGADAFAPTRSAPRRAEGEVPTSPSEVPASASPSPEESVVQRASDSSAPRHGPSASRMKFLGGALLALGATTAGFATWQGASWWGNGPRHGADGEDSPRAAGTRAPASKVPTRTRDASADAGRHGERPDPSAAQDSGQQRAASRERKRQDRDERRARERSERNTRAASSSQRRSRRSARERPPSESRTRGDTIARPARRKQHRGTGADPAGSSGAAVDAGVAVPIADEPNF